MRPPAECLDSATVAPALFHPRRQGGAPLDGPRAFDATIAADDGTALGLRLFPAAAADAPLVLLFHGNGEIAGDYTALADLWTERDVALAVADFRGYGLSGGSPSASTLQADALAVWRGLSGVLKARGLAPSARVVMGRSLGSAAACAVAAHARPGPDGLIVESGFADTFALVHRVGGRCPLDGLSEDTDGFGNPGLIGQVDVPTLVLHGAEDGIIPASEGRQLHAAAGAPDHRLMVIPGAGHNDLFAVAPEAYMDAVERLVRTAVTG